MANSVVGGIGWYGRDRLVWGAEVVVEGSLEAMPLYLRAEWWE